MTEASALALPAASEPREAPAAVPSVRRVPALDGLRGLAALLVLVFHCAPDPTVLGFRSSILVHSAWVGVDLFFVLSGFLITRGLIELQDVGNRYFIFYARRVLRIFPLYYFALTPALCLFLTIPAARPEAAKLAAPAWYYLYSYNIYVLIPNDWAGCDYLDHFWSLCVEEQFYLVWPFLVFNLRGRRLLAGMLATLGLAVLAKLLLAAAGVGWAPIYASTPTRMDAFALGGLGAYAEAYGLGRRENGKHLTRAAGVVALLVLAYGAVYKGLPIDSRLTHLTATPAVDLLFGLVVFLLACSTRPLLGLRRLCATRWLGLVGTYSYGIYVYHWIVFVLLIQLNVLGFVGNHPLQNFLLTTAVTLLVAVASFHLIERPFLRLKERVAYPARPATA
jgi:peptidoglycan/LPS O-acetylase OafA/YrhL